MEDEIPIWLPSSAPEDNTIRRNWALRNFRSVFGSLFMTLRNISANTWKMCEEKVKNTAFKYKNSEESALTSTDCPPLQMWSAICLSVVILASFNLPSVDFDTIRELTKMANILGYLKVVLYIRCLFFLSTGDNAKKEKESFVAILFAWVAGDVIDSVDGPLARYTQTASDFGERLDHHFFDRFREPFVLMVFATIYPKYRSFWHVLLLRMFVLETSEGVKFVIPRVPVFPFINIAWYFPVIIVCRYLQFVRNHFITNALKLYLGCVFLTWGLEGDPPQKIRLDFYVQCYFLGQSNKCASIGAL